MPQQCSLWWQPCLLGTGAMTEVLFSEPQPSRCKQRGEGEHRDLVVKRGVPWNPLMLTWRSWG